MTKVGGTMKFDCIVIGGGPSGLMASIGAAEQGASVLLIDKGDKLGKKLAISGGGRCNVTNNRSVEEIIEHVPGNGRFLYSAFSLFNNQDIITFFEGLGVKLKEEDHGRMFPVSNSAQSVIDALLKRLEQLHVTIWTNHAVNDIHFTDGQVSSVELRDGRHIETNKVIVAVGGKSVPKTGSTGDGYPWFEKAGHTITELFPTEVPVTSNEPFIRDKSLQGLALKDVAVSVLNPKGKALVTHRMDMLFTHFGLSGPAILRCSQFVVKAMKKWDLKEVEIVINAIPYKKEEPLFLEVQQIIKEDAKKAIKNSLKGLLPERYLHFLLEKSEIDLNAQSGTISNEKLRKFVSLCKAFPVKVNGTLPLDKAFVTGGGISVKEINPKTMESKFVNGLYACGEILDIHGYTGGYNITCALVTGRLAGLHAGSKE